VIGRAWEAAVHGAPPYKRYRPSYLQSHKRS